MTKISISFLVGFSALTFAGAAMADGATEAVAGGLGNSLSANGVALSRMGQSAIQLNAGTTDLQRSASALNSDSAASSLKGATGGGIASAKIGIAPAGGRPSADGSIFANALSSPGAANALRIGGGDSKPLETVSTTNAMGVLGMGGGNLGEALGSQKINADQRIGPK